MLLLPKVNKNPKRALSRLERAQKVVAGVALALGVTLAGAPATDAHAAIAPTQISQTTQQPNGAMVLSTPQAASELLAYHYSHYSHSSHYSHYSSSD